MEGAGDQLLARSALSGDEYRRLGARHPAIMEKARAHGRRAPDYGRRGPALVDEDGLGGLDHRVAGPTGPSFSAPRIAARARRLRRPWASATREATDEARESARSRETEVAVEKERAPIAFPPMINGNAEALASKTGPVEARICPGAQCRARRAGRQGPRRPDRRRRLCEPRRRRT